MAAREPIFKMTFLKSTFSSELISCEMWDLEQKTKEIQYFFKSNIVKMFHFWKKSSIFRQKISSKLFIKWKV